HNMLLVHGDPETLRPNTIEKYFFSSRWPSRNFLKLLYVDGCATIGPDGKGMTGLYERIKARMAEIKRTTGSAGSTLAKPLLTGDDVIQELNLKPGPKVGKILEEVRSKQLSGELSGKDEAAAYIKTL
ncbi:MAG: hypothetical protein U1C18_00190, partial [Patescibacteria group bacterium]|nr:hypothetical protein [Patescibacteria group bacterium]